MTIENSSERKGVFKISGQEGSVFTVNLPDGSPRYILLQEVDELVGLLEDNYQGGKKPINPIEELDGLISVLKQTEDEIVEEIVQNAPPNVVPNVEPNVDVPFPQETEPTTQVQVGISPHTEGDQRATEFYDEQERAEKVRANRLMRPPKMTEQGTQEVDEEGELVYLDPSTENAEEAQEIYSAVAQKGTQHLQTALDEAGFEGFTVTPNFGLFGPTYEPSLYVEGPIRVDQRDQFMELMVNVADTDFDQKSVIIHEAPEEEYPDFGVVEGGQGEAIEPAVPLRFERPLTAKEFNDLGKILNRISDGTIGFASLPDGTGMNILNLSVYNTDYDDFISTVEEFVADDESQRISGKTRRDVGQARRTWIIGRESGPAGYYSEGHWETRDEYDGLISYDEYRSYLRSTAEASEESEEVIRKSTFVPYTVSSFAKRMVVEEMDDLMDILKQDDPEEEPPVSNAPQTPSETLPPPNYPDAASSAPENPTPHTKTEPPVSNEERGERAESHETVPPVTDPTPTARKFDQTALQTKRPINIKPDVIQLWEVNEGTRSPVASTYAGDWSVLREVERRTQSEEPQLCMQAAHMAARVNNGKFVQGTVIGNEGTRIAHAWAEVGRFAYDAVRGGGGIIQPIEEFYESGQAEDIKKLTSLEAEELHYEFDTSGLWGPYTEEEIESVRGQSYVDEKEEVSPWEKSQQSQEKEYETIKNLDIVSSDEMEKLNVVNVTSWKHAEFLSERNKKAFGKVYELSDLTLPDEYDRRGQVIDRDETITVFHGTNAEGAKRILESNQLGYQREGRKSATGTGFHLYLEEARGFAGAKNIDAGADTREDVMPVILMFDLPIDKLEEWGFHADPHAGGPSGGAFISSQVIDIPSDSHSDLLPDIKIVDGVGRNFSLLGEEGIETKGIPRDLIQAHPEANHQGLQYPPAHVKDESFTFMDYTEELPAVDYFLPPSRRFVDKELSYFDDNETVAFHILKDGKEEPLGFVTHDYSQTAYGHWGQAHLYMFRDTDNDGVVDNYSIIRTFNILDEESRETKSLSAKQIDHIKEWVGRNWQYSHLTDPDSALLENPYDEDATEVLPNTFGSGEGTLEEQRMIFRSLHRNSYAGAVTPKEGERLVDTDLEQGTIHGFRWEILHPRASVRENEALHFNYSREGRDTLGFRAWQEAPYYDELHVDILAPHRGDKSGKSQLTPDEGEPISIGEWREILRFLKEAFPNATSVVGTRETVGHSGGGTKEIKLALKDTSLDLYNLLIKQMIEENPQQQIIPAGPTPTNPDDMIYSSQNEPPSADVPVHTGVRGGDFWLRSEARTTMKWDEDQLNAYLNTEHEEIQGGNLEDLEAEKKQLESEKKILTRKVRRAFNASNKAKDALDQGRISEEEAISRREAYKAAKDELSAKENDLYRLDVKIEGLAADALETPSEESMEDIEPVLDSSIEHLEEILKEDPEATDEHKEDIFAILDEWSEKEQEVRTDIDEMHDDEYYANSTVQDAITAVTRVSETTNWRNLERLSEIPLVSQMILNGNLDDKISVLSTRLDAYKTIGAGILEHFEKSYTLPSLTIAGKPAISDEGDWRQAPMDVATLTKLMQKKKYQDYVWFSEDKISQKVVLRQLSSVGKRQLKRDTKAADLAGEAPPDKEKYFVGGKVEEVTFGQILDNLDVIFATANQNARSKLQRPASLIIRDDETGRKIRNLKLQADVLENVQQIVLDELPDKFGPPSLSSAFKKRFQEAANPYTQNPAIDTDNLISELYGATKFGKFHTESSSEMEKSTNSLLSGLIKDVIGDLTNSKIVHHGSRNLRDRDGKLVALEEGYKRFPKEHVSEYARVHKRLTRQLLDFMYPNSDAIEMYRGTQDAKLKAFAEPAIAAKKDSFIKRVMNSGVQGAKLMIEHNPVTQYSTNPLTAYDFGVDQRVTRPDDISMDKPVTAAARGQGGLILVQQVPKDDIWSSYGTGHAGSFRKGSEREFYVSSAKGKRHATATAYLPSDFYDYITQQGGTFQKQQEQLLQDDVEDTDLVLVIDDEINSDWIQMVHELWADHPDVGEKSKMPPIKVEPTNVDGPSTTGQKTGMPLIPVEQQNIIETTPTVQKAFISKQQELAQTLAQADPDASVTPTEEAPIHPAAQGKVRTVIFELVNRAGKTFERRRTAWVNPKVAETINSRQKATDWLRLLGNYLPLYFVGGFVRDKLMGKVSSDVDIISLVPLEKVQETFDSLNIEYKKVSAKDKKILTLKVAGMDVDVAAAEAEDLPKDLMKRDFTINAVAQSVTGQFYDPSNGLKDIKEKVLRSPRNQSDKRFQEDPVRMMRAARFIGNYKLKVHPSVIRAIKKNKDKLKDMPNARIGRELSKIMQTERPSDALEFMAEHDLLDAVDPALGAMVDYKQNTPHHKWDLWKHTITALKKAESEDMVLNLAILFHDIGKPNAADEGQVTFHGHEKHSADHVAQILKRLAFPDDIRKRVENLVGMHMRLLTMPETAKVGAFRRLKIQAGEDFDRLVKLAKADTAGSGVDVDAKHKQLDVIIAKIKNIEDVPDKKNLSPLTGQEIIESVGIREGPQVGEIKEHLHNLVIDEDLDATDKEGAVKEARNYMADVSKQLDYFVGILSNA